MTESSRVDGQMMRAVNRSLIETHLRESEGPLSRATLAKRSGLAKPTVSAIVEDLIAEGLVKEVGRGRTATAGRPPVLLEYDARQAFVVGVVISRGRVTAAAADAHGEIGGRAECPLPRRGDQIEPLVDAVEQALAAAGAPRRLLAAVGVSVPGMLDQSTGVCLLAPHIGWRNVPVRSELSSRLDVPAFALNDNQAAVVAEAEAGAARGAGEVVFYRLDYGISAGVLSRGKILSGQDGMAGEIGHCRLPGLGDLCTCGKRGCLETVGSTGAIAKAAGLRRWDQLARAFAAGEEAALDAVDRAAEALGLAGSWLVNLYNPEVLVLAGPVPDLHPTLRQRIGDAILGNALPAHRERVRITGPGLGEDSVLRGALLLARQRTTEHYRVVFGAV